MKLLEEKKSGHIKDFETQVEYILQDGFTYRGKRIRKLSYITDFKVILNDNSFYLVDIKGMLTDVFKIKQKLFQYRYNDIELKLIKYSPKKGFYEI